MLLHACCSIFAFFQIGNAVPPPLAKALGLEILKSIHLKEKQRKLEEDVKMDVDNFNGFA